MLPTSNESSYRQAGSTRCCLWGGGMGLMPANGNAQLPPHDNKHLGKTVKLVICCCAARFVSCSAMALPEEAALAEVFDVAVLGTGLVESIVSG